MSVYIIECYACQVTVYASCKSIDCLYGMVSCNHAIQLSVYMIEQHTSQVGGCIIWRHAGQVTVYIIWRHASQVTVHIIGRHVSQVHVYGITSCKSSKSLWHCVMQVK